MKNKFFSYKNTIGVFLVWRFSILIFSFFAVYLLGGYLNPQKVNFLEALSSWDGGHFIGIAKFGYQYHEQYAFFPLYPLLIKTFAPFFLNSFNLSALFLSSVFSFLILLFFQKIGELDFKKTEIQKAVFLFLSFPTSFFLTVAYSESFFIFLAVASLYYSRKDKWILAAILAALASATKPFGIILFAVLIFEYFKQKNYKIKKIGADILVLVLSLSGIGLYMGFLKLTVGNAFVFLTSQANWQREFFSFPSKVIWERYLSVFSLDQIGTRFFAQHALELVAVLFFVIILIYSIGKLRSTYIFYCLLLLLMPLSTGVLLSFPRYFILAFPLFFSFAALSRNQLFEKFLFVFFLLFQGLFFTLFLTGIWIA